MLVFPSLPLPATKLQLQPPVGPVAYQVMVTWETYTNGDYQLLKIEKELTLEITPNTTGYVLDFRTAPPRLLQPTDPEPLAVMALRLAELYEWVRVQASATGEIVSLLNHEALLQTWNRLASAMQASTTADDQVTSAVLSFISQQLPHPERLLHSLRHDYLYQALLPEWYNQPLGSAAELGRPQQFSSFFAKTSLWFTEHVAVLPTDSPVQLHLHCSGTLDARQTDVAAVQAQIAQALRLAAPATAPPVPDELPAPHFRYEAHYELEASTGLPLHVGLTVYARTGQLFNKEYTLVINRL